ncbi:hypothetical protein AVEN_18731-1 [Araneus ventricosus]|uniref:Uncharacterized protein n=1 Tax=Araneus ventricosus TaxID=182803 RepID=A0A4Y2GME7_ARAVE|nr:hypothetical protein AVEN_18731-1 [Araneus ventricosus]
MKTPRRSCIRSNLRPRFYQMGYKQLLDYFFVNDGEEERCRPGENTGQRKIKRIFPQTAWAATSGGSPFSYLRDEIGKKKVKIEIIHLP